MRRHSDTLQPGMTAPDFALADTAGRTHSLRELLAGGGTLLLVFDRGTW
jgi:peroxiredoxin